ncbi:MAG: CDP-2,3-bis-(O-geranylgeranyl)-sn-glycerol synthase [Candidatus Hodarchaeales archaeon]|jgi:CDP-2,3-bis-(O-geranylgeranyl)-sn-glycerol synthase
MESLNIFEYLVEIFEYPVRFFFEILWFVAPAYLANGMPAVFGGGTPIDLGKNWRDGRRILGDGKTWRGAIAGFALAMLLAAWLWWIGPHIVIDDKNFNDRYAIFARSALMAIGTLSGDALGSFIKRRRNMERGQMFLGMDQLGFLVVSFVLVFLTFPLSMEPRYTWMDFTAFVVILIPVTFAVHLIFNWGSWKVGLKDVPY